MGALGTILIVAILVIGVFAFFLMIYDSYKIRKLRRRYKEENDKSRAGEQRRNIKSRESGIKRFSESPERSLLQATIPNTDGADSSRAINLKKSLRERIRSRRKG
jgi:hypothetical protein